MATYTDADGNTVETLSPEEATALKAQAEEATTLKTQMAEQQAKLQALESKDLNFKRLRDMNAEEKAKLSADQLAAKQEVEELRTKMEERDRSTLEDAKSDFFTRNIGTNEDLKRKVEYEYSLLNLPDGTAAQMKAKYEKAYTNATGGTQINPLHAYVPSTGYDATRSTTPSVKDLKPEVADLASRMGLSFTKK